MTTTVHVATSQPYDVLIGRGLDAAIIEAVPEDVHRVLVVHTAVMARRADALKGAIEASGRVAVLAEVPDAEAGKTAEVLAFCWKVLGQSEFTRSDLVVGLGGGAVTDLAGFVAASWLRGVRYVAVPTTLQAMVDAAIGGKTGINTAEGKNLVGAFHEPTAVIADTDFVLTQPRNDLVAGLAEVVKAGFIRDLTILDLIEANITELSADTSSEPLGESSLELIEDLAARAVRVKAAVVAADLKEASEREILNYGHTLGHAIEHVERYQWRHGAAVSVGMVFAAELGRLTKGLSDDAVDRHRAILGGLGLPLTYPGGRWEQLAVAMRRDKKARGTMQRFVVLQDLGRPTRVEGPDPVLVAAAYDAISR